jgi:O-antigen/teichoic acid export membrane protein
LIGVGGLGLVIGHAASQVVAVVVMTFTIVQIFKVQAVRTTLTLRQACRSVFVGGIPSWIPASITSIGAQLGTVVVFGASGANQAGTFFIAFSILSAVIMVGNSLLTSAFPVLSALKDGRKRLSWRITKLSLFISVPISSSFMFYPHEILGLLGPAYVESSVALQVLLLSVFPVIVSMGINTLAYSYGNYRQVLTIGLATTVPRTVLYFVLVPLYDGTGAAISYTVGSVIGYIFSIIVARQIGFNIFWKDQFLILVIPASVAFVLSYLEVTYIVGLVMTLAITYIMFLVLRIMTKSDIADSVSVLPPKLSKSTLKLMDMVGDKLRR